MGFLTPVFVQAAAGDAPIQLDGDTLRGFVSAVVRREGVCGVTALAVNPRAAGANMSVDVSSGRCVIDGDTSPTQGRYACSTDSSVYNLAIPSNPGTASRVHRVIARVYDKQVDSGTVTKWQVELQEDTGSGTPALPPSAIALAEVTVTPGAGAVVANNISDKRIPAAGLPPLVPHFLQTGGEIALPVKTRVLYAPAATKGDAYGFNIPDVRKASAQILVKGSYVFYATQRIAVAPSFEESSVIIMRKNWAGAELERVTGFAGIGNTNGCVANASAPFDCEVGDFVECYVYTAVGSTHTVASLNENRFGGYMASIR